MDRYRVKFTDQTGTHFGIADNYSDEAQAARQRGNVLVEDAVYPLSYLVPENLIVDIPSHLPEYDENRQLVPGDDYERYVQGEYQAAQERSRQAGTGLKPGKLFTVGVADGFAWYVVTKVNKKTVRVEWRSFQGDRRFDRWLGYGGIVAKDRIEPLVKRMDALEERSGDRCDNVPKSSLPC